jgi:hypothetical protein
MDPEDRRTKLQDFNFEEEKINIVKCEQWTV